MNIFSNLSTDASIEDEQDVLGGGSKFSPLESGLYDLTIKQAYLEIATSGAMAMKVYFETEEGRELTQQFWMTSGTAKGGKNYYIDKQTGQKKFLPGFNMANSLSRLSADVEVPEVTMEEKVISLWNHELRKEAPQKVNMFTDLLGKTVVAAVFKQVVDKKAKNDAGEYVPTGETREENEIVKFFRTGSRVTVAEAKAGVTEGVFADQWAEKWTGVTKDKSSKDAPKGNTGQTGAPKASATPAPKKSLFAN